MKTAGEIPMSRVAYRALFLLGLCIALVVAAFQPSPGYMDADYYYATGSQIASGQGFVEPFLWNYLDDPAGLPHPSHLYWMPLAALLAAFGMWFGGILTSGVHSSGIWATGALPGEVSFFFAAKAGFLILAACLPPATAALASSFGASQRQAWMAGLLALFSGFYLPFLTTTDTFGIYMLAGMLFLQAGGRMISRASAGTIRRNQLFIWSALTGVLAGLMHLARADGLIWIVVGLAATWTASSRLPARQGSPPQKGFASKLPFLTALLLGYLLVLSPWMARNLRLAGSFSAPGASRALWITRYDELFTYPAGLLTPERWWSTGMGEILGARLWALGQNLQSTLAVQGEVFLVPLILAGLWRFRKDPRVWLASLAWALTFLVMTLVFPFQGSRGGWFHSGAAVQPLFWALAPLGLQTLVDWGESRRGWISGKAEVAFGWGVIALAMLVTILTAFPRVVGTELAGSAWGESGVLYARMEQSLQDSGAHLGSSVLVNNPPGYYSATGRPALVIPDGDLEAVLAVARRYQSAYLLLEPNHSRALQDLYQNPGDRPGLDYLFSVGAAHIYYLGNH